MRYVGLALAVLLISVPAAAVAGPDALSIAKRALALAKEPPKVAYVYDDEAVVTGPDTERLEARCPRGMVAMGLASESPALYEAISGRQGVVVIARQPSMGPRSGLTVTCIEGRVR